MVLIVSEQFNQSTLDGVGHGSIVALRVRDRTTFGLTVQDVSPGGRHGVICLSPGHPQAGDRPGVFERGAFGQSRLFHFPNVRLQPTAMADGFEFDRDRGWEDGTLLMLGSEFYVVAATGNRASGVWNARDGARADNVAQDENVVGFSSWQVTIAEPGTSAVTLFEVSTRRRLPDLGARAD